jgi:hypothetical protein
MLAFLWAAAHTTMSTPKGANVHEAQARVCWRLQHVHPTSSPLFAQGFGDSAQKARALRFFVLHECPLNDAFL